MKRQHTQTLLSVFNEHGTVHPHELGSRNVQKKVWFGYRVVLFGFRPLSPGEHEASYEMR